MLKCVKTITMKKQNRNLCTLFHPTIIPYLPSKIQAYGWSFHLRNFYLTTVINQRENYEPHFEILHSVQAFKFKLMYFHSYKCFWEISFVYVIPVKKVEKKYPRAASFLNYFFIAPNKEQKALFWNVQTYFCIMRLNPF